jgi:crotonobetainyl-CoA:carnitine CoA-transferase CaiB-like acyl-CoA transferase
VRLLGAPVKLSRTPAAPTRAPGPGLGDHTDEVLGAAGYSAEEIAALHETGAVAGPTSVAKGSFLSA